MSVLRVVWVCHFSNEEVRNHMSLSYPWYERLIRKVLNKELSLGWIDYAIWNSNGIKEFKKFDDVELHVISPASHLSKNCVEFVSDNIHYHFFKSQRESLFSRTLLLIIKKFRLKYTSNARRINTIIKNIRPDIIHLIGPENRDYSVFALYTKHSIPIIAQLDTLVCEPSFRLGYPKSSWKNWEYAGEIEKRVIQTCGYVGTESKRFRDFVLTDINRDAIVFNIDLATGFDIDKTICDKQYDFVYFANSITKSLDLAIEAFAIAKNKHPEITLDVIGGCPDDFKSIIDARLEELGISSSVTFEGRFPTHGDVIMQIKKSRFALLPFKIDYNPTTIPESMANGLPVIATMTGGTEILYKNEEEILLTPVGDHIKMANNMIRLLESDSLADKIRTNAFKKILKDFNNYDRMRKWVMVYQSIYSHYYSQVPVPVELMKYEG